MEVVRIRLCLHTAATYPDLLHGGAPDGRAPDGTHKSGCPICYHICYPQEWVSHLLSICYLTGTRRPRRPVAQTSSTQARIRWCAMAMGPGTFSVGCSPASARRASSRGNQRTSAISTGSMRMSVVSASP